jgi:Domain of unknown function (DUF397)
MIEMGCQALYLLWRKSSYSMGDGQCVEAACSKQAIAIRDSKDPGHVIFFAKNQWKEFLITIKH